MSYNKTKCYHVKHEPMKLVNCPNSRNDLVNKISPLDCYISLKRERISHLYAKSREKLNLLATRVLEVARSAECFA